MWKWIAVYSVQFLLTASTDNYFWISLKIQINLQEFVFILKLKKKKVLFEF